MFLWDQWKKGFDAWEDTTAKYLEQVLKSPVVLGPSGAMLTATMKAKAQADQAAAKWWSAVGLPTRRDQERMLHEIHQLHSRLTDLEDELAAAKGKKG